jgi:hypothetical protein
METTGISFSSKSFPHSLPLFLQGWIKDNVYAMEVQDSNDMISCNLVALAESRANLNRWFESGTIVSIFMKPVFRLEEVT